MLLYVLPIQLPLGVTLLHPFHATLQLLLVLHPQPLHHLADVRQVKVPAEVVHTIAIIMLRSLLRALRQDEPEKQD